MSRDLLAPPTHRGSLATRSGLAGTYIMSTGAGLGRPLALCQKTKDEIELEVSKDKREGIKIKMVLKSQTEPPLSPCQSRCPLSV